MRNTLLCRQIRGKNVACAWSAADRIPAVTAGMNQNHIACQKLAGTSQNPGNARHREKGNLLRIKDAKKIILRISACLKIFFDRKSQGSLIINSAMQLEQDSAIARSRPAFPYGLRFEIAQPGTDQLISVLFAKMIPLSSDHDMTMNDVGQLSGMKKKAEFF